jgi:uncharacterized protein
MVGMTQQLEQRNLAEKITLETREEGKSSVIQGYAALFDVETEIRGYWGAFKESVAPGAFAKSIRDNRRVVSLFNHDSNILLGSTSGGTLRIKEDDKGLFMEVEPPDTQVGRDVVESIRRGDVQGQSIMFEIVGEEWTFAQKKGEMDSRRITDVILWECGPVTFPAYEQTSVGLRSASEEAYKQARAEWERANKPEEPVAVTFDPSGYLLKVRCLRASL